MNEESLLYTSEKDPRTGPGDGDSLQSFCCLTRAIFGIVQIRDDITRFTRSFSPRDRRGEDPGRTFRKGGTAAAKVVPLGNLST